MKILNQVPPNYEDIKKVFSGIEDKEVCFAYGDVIYNPKGAKLAEHLIVHENVHSLQQNTDPKGWWDRYLTDSAFRIEQEVQAYASQYTYIKRLYRRKVSDMFLDEIAHDLSSEIYGNIISFAEAHSRIRRFAKSMI